MMKVMLAAIEIFSLVYQRIFAQKVLTQRKHSRVWECFVWGMYFVISNFFTYSFAKSAWDNTGIFVVSFFFALRILYIDSAWVLSAVTAFMAISGALSEVLTYYGWQIFVQKSGVKVDTANEDYLLLLVSKLVMFFFIKILLALIKRHKNIRLNTQEWVEIFMIPGGSIVILAEMICQKESMSETLDFVAALMVMLINIFTYYLYDKIGETAEKRVREEVLQEQSEYYLRQYNENMNLWVEMSEFRHNMTERYLMEKMYLEKGDYEALKKYCDNSLEKLHKQRKVSNTGCFYFDSIINYKAAVAETFDIKFETKLMIPRDLKVETEDICICLGNLLDNAIEASKKVKAEERSVCVEIRVDRRNLMMMVSNHYEEERKKSGNHYMTTKKEKHRHIASDFDGTVFICHNVIGAVIKSDFHDIIFFQSGSKEEIAAVLEHEGNAAVCTEVAAVLGEDMANVCNSTGSVVRGAVDDQSCAADAVAFVTDFFVVGAFKLTGAFQNGIFNSVFRHVGCPCFQERESQTRIHVRVSAA